VLDGFVARERAFNNEAALDLVGPGDVLRPWDHDGGYPLATITTRWKVLEPARIALLDGDVLRRIAPWPALMVELLGRLTLRARSLAVRLAISQHTRIVVGVAYLFWHIAERWGRQPEDGRIHLARRLTHGEIGRMIGTHRPPVTAALGRLRDERLVTRLPDGMWEVTLDLPRRIEHMR
jgi:CRP/FNR family cyclic AMP-dependent transcriptional regulator